MGRAVSGKRAWSGGKHGAGVGMVVRTRTGRMTSRGKSLQASVAWLTNSSLVHLVTGSGSWHCRHNVRPASDFFTRIG